MDGDGVPRIARQYTGEVTSLVQDAHAAGLEVVPYTLRDEENFQTLEADGSFSGPLDEYRKFIDLGMDGFFTDLPGTGRRAVNQHLGGTGLGGPEVDWDYLAAEVTRNHEATGRWYL